MSAERQKGEKPQTDAAFRTGTNHLVTRTYTRSTACSSLRVSHLPLFMKQIGGHRAVRFSGTWRRDSGTDSTHRARRALMVDLSTLHLKRKDKKAI